MPAPLTARLRWWRLTAVLAVAAALGAAGVGRAAEQGLDAASAVVATGSAPLETEIMAETLEVEERPDGTPEKRFAEARRLKAGEEIYYTIRVRNPGKEPVQDIVVTKRLPYGVDYVRGSAVGPACDVELSADGGVTFAAGTRAAGYTHVRWTMRRPLAPGATALLRFRAIFR